MGRTALVLDELAAGRLVDLWGLHVRSEAAYHLVRAPTPTPSPQVAEVETWLLAEGAAFDTARRRLLALDGSAPK
ncbi:DNA-binding transcriptional activator GcvA [compost metagenome]